MVVGPVELQRFAKLFSRYKLKFLAKFIDYIIRLVFGCWFPHTVVVGKGLVLGYGGLGVVIHKDAVLGSFVHIDQHVTIGGNGTKFGVPVIGSNVYIGAGAKILGPITIGDNVKIGANSVVIRDVPSNVVFAGVPAKFIKNIYIS
ncbi:serine O-acetyltransferase [Sphaerotilus sp.]|uniref:serine O-acetyltransferase n=1 Tax=Sphaerotilus sp. TaxID=2093942 RepID=UPI002ACEDD2D|nr:DapH/DapD/GlmU-related protein [Sphaerotilus sp.]MDZ7856204.1 DapH/DapD/GlmU-related protein [Sphaerotilus sp.]